MPAQSLGMDFRMEYDPIATERQLVGFGLNGVLRSRMVDTSAGWNRQNYQTGNQFTSNNYIQQTTGAAPGRQQDRRDRAVQLRHRPQHDVEPALHRELQRPVLRPRRRVPDLQLPRAGSSCNQDRRFNVSFTLAGIGSFSNFFGTFGGGNY